MTIKSSNADEKSKARLNILYTMTSIFKFLMLTKTEKTPLLMSLALRAYVLLYWFCAKSELSPNHRHHHSLLCN